MNLSFNNIFGHTNEIVWELMPGPRVRAVAQAATTSLTNPSRRNEERDRY